MHRYIFFVLALVLGIAPVGFDRRAQAQSVQQSGNVTPGHAMCWALDGVAYDCGTPGGSSIVGSFTANDLVAVNGSGSLIDSGISPVATSNITSLWNFNGGVTAPTRSLGDNTTNVATTAFVVAAGSAALNIPNTWTALQTFTAGITANGTGITVNPTAASTTPALTANQTLAGTEGASETCTSICINITSDTIVSGLGINDILINHSYGGASVTGVRSGILVNLIQTAKTNVSNPFPVAVGMAGAVTINSGAGDAGGTYFGENPQVRSAAASVTQLTGSESDIFGTAAATQLYQFAYSAVGLFANHGSTLDAAYEIHMGASSPYGSAAPGPGWGFGLVAAELSNGYTPIASTGTFIGTYLPTLTTIPVAIAIDLRGFVTSTADIFGRNWNVTAGGAITGSSLVSNGGSITVGANTSAPGALAIASAAGAGAFVLVKNPSATSTYNFNLPATAGSSGQVLTSAGGSTSPMTWTSVASSASPTFSGTVTMPDGSQWSSTGLFSGPISVGNLFRLTYGTPTIASGACGTGTNGSVAGSNQAGLVTVGGSATATCTVSFSTTLANAPAACIVTQSAGTAELTKVTSVGTTNFVIAGTTMANTSYYYICI